MSSLPGRLLAIEKGIKDVWELELAGNGRPRRLGTLRGFGRSRAVASAAHDGLLGVLDVAGGLSVLRAESPTAGMRVPLHVSPGTSPVALLAVADSGWVIAEQRSSIDARGRVRDSALFVRVTGAGAQKLEWATERVGPDRQEALLSDYFTANAYDDTVVATFADPPRIVLWRVGASDSRREFALRNSPRRPMSRRDRSDIERALTASHHLGGRSAYEYPPIAGARPRGRGWFVVGGAGRQRFALDFYCDETFKETLLDHESITKVVLLDSAAVVMREDSVAGRLRVEVYPYRAFAVGCPSP